MKKQYIILIHLFFWFYIINQGLFPLYIGKLDHELLVSNQYLKDLFVSLLMSVAAFYTIYFWFPRLLKIKYKLFAFFTGLLLLALITTFIVITEFYIWKFLLTGPTESFKFETIYIWNNLRMVIITGIYAILIRFMINWFEAQKLRDELINQQQASKLALIRSQVNPHFFFNTLNNIYALVYRKDEKAPEALMKLSSIMRYMLYDSASPKVPIEKEIEYLRSFIELQILRIRYADFVSLQIEGDIQGATIAPMLLISFVENAFKHGSKVHHPGILIRLSVSGDTISFQVINYLKKSALNEDTSSGIGLETIRRRLELIYPGQHKLVVKPEKETFLINLEISR